MTIRKTFKPCIGGATPKRGQVDFRSEISSLLILGSRVNIDYL
jgi:hypothetical protein